MLLFEWFLLPPVELVDVLPLDRFRFPSEYFRLFRILFSDALDEAFFDGFGEFMSVVFAIGFCFERLLQQKAATNIANSTNAPPTAMPAMALVRKPDFLVDEDCKDGCVIL